MFWKWAVDTFVGRQPTTAHRLLVKLHDEGILLRVYTQNIDGLEKAAGIPAEKIVECHGSVSSFICSADHKHPVNGGISLEKIGQNLAVGLPAPCCSSCNALLRPDLAFFGEPVSSDFGRLSGEDLCKCDLLIVMGTTLQVYPVAGIVNQVPKLAPRLLINKERVGPWRSSAGLEGDCNTASYRDVFFEGTCDAGAAQLGQLLGYQALRQLNVAS
jgi:NAD-dependent SIR2 family protein deacetylase